MEECMKALRPFVAILIVFSLFSPRRSAAQEKPNATGKATSTLLKLQVLIVEKEGEKKVSNLPYTFFVKAGEGGGPGSPWTKLRTGSRVPVYVGKEASMQYIDVGTNIDARGQSAEDGRFDLTLNLERSWVAGEVDVPVEKSAGAADGNSSHFKQPIIRQFKTELTLPMHDGQSSEITQAADPGSGRVLTITVILNVVK
jgi:hypothetical protein